jgi:hypothetical protein
MFIPKQKHLPMKYYIRTQRIKRARAEMAVGVSGNIYNTSCSGLGSKSKANPNGAGYKKRRSLKVAEREAGTIWKTYTGEVGTTFAASGGYSGTFLLTW